MILPGGIIGGALPSLTRTATLLYSGANVTTMTFASTNLGTAGKQRRIAVLLGWLGTPTVNAVTVAGVSATSVTSQVIAVNKRAALWIADVPSGTSGNIVLTMSAGENEMWGAVYALYSLRSSTATDSAVTVALGGGNYSTSVDVEKNGLIVGLVIGDTASAITVTGLDSPTVIDNAPRVVDASYVASAAETPRTITWAVPTTNRAGFAASFR